MSELEPGIAVRLSEVTYGYDSLREHIAGVRVAALLERQELPEDEERERLQEECVAFDVQAQHLFTPIEEYHIFKIIRDEFYLERFDRRGMTRLGIRRIGDAVRYKKQQHLLLPRANAIDLVHRVTRHDKAILSFGIDYLQIAIDLLDGFYGEYDQ